MEPPGQIGVGPWQRCEAVDDLFHNRLDRPAFHRQCGVGDGGKPKAAIVGLSAQRNPRVRPELAPMIIVSEPVGQVGGRSVEPHHHVALQQPLACFVIDHAGRGGNDHGLGPERAEGIRQLIGFDSVQALNPELPGKLGAGCVVLGLDTGVVVNESIADGGGQGAPDGGLA